MENIQQYFEYFPGTPPFVVPDDYRCSVHWGNIYRLEKAKEQVSFPPANMDVIIAHVHDLSQNESLSAPIADKMLQLKEISTAVR